MRVLVIGGDAGGMSAAMQVRRRRPDWEVVVLERGRFTSYSACGIPYWLAGDVDALEDLVAVSPEAFREKRGVDVRTGWEALAVDPAARRVAARRPEGGEEELAWDRLLLATGASPVVPDWEGMHLEGVATVKSLRDAAHVARLLEAGPRRAVVVGAGYVGIEMAEALRRRGLAVTVVERSEGVLGGEPEVTARVAEAMRAHDITLRLETEVTGLGGRDGRLRGVDTEAGPIEADLAIVALGIRPNAELARDAGIELGAAGAVAVDRGQRTSAPEVWAAGDCTETWHRVLGRPAWIPLGLTANRQGRVAGATLCDAEERFPGVVGSAVTRLFDLVVARTGIDARTARDEGIACESAETTATSKAGYFPGASRVWVKVLFRADDRRLLGGYVVGRDESAAKRADVLATAISAGLTVDALADLDLTYAPPFAPVWDPVLQAASRARFARDASRREPGSRG